LTIKFHSNISNLLIGQGILAAGYNAPCSITVYSGSQPMPINIVNDWLSYKASNTNFLINYTDVEWSHALNGEAPFCSIDTFPASTLPVHAGDGAWAILWPRNITTTNLSQDAIPETIFLVVPVSILTGNGVIRFEDNVTFVMDTPKAIADGAILAGITN